MIAARLLGLLWRRGGARQRGTLALTASGVLVSVVLALLALSVPSALTARADRTAWRTPTTSRDSFGPRAYQRTTTDTFGHRAITRIDLAPVPPTGSPDDGDPGQPPVPPGTSHFPRPGELFASPALARLLRQVPAAELADRYPGTLTETIGPDGMGHADELILLVGRPAGALDGLPQRDPTVAGPPLDGDVARLDHFASFDEGDAAGSRTSTYQSLAWVGAILLVVPTLVLIGAAARLTAAQREQRLVALRLAGASPSTVVGLTALELGLAAVLGVVAGIAGYLAALPWAAHVRLAGGPFRTSDLRLSTSALVVVAVLVPALAVTTAVVALRSVVGGPLHAARRTAPRRPSLLRFAVLPVAWGLLASTATSMRDGGSTFGVMMGVAAVIVSLSVLGPWVTWAVGAGLGRLARRPTTLIAARRITDDPQAAFRTVSGMVLAGLIAGFLFGVLPTVQAATLPGTDATNLDLAVPAGQVGAVRSAAADGNGSLRTAATFDDTPDRAAPGSPGGGSDGSHDGGSRSGTIRFARPDQADRVRTLVLSAAPDAEVTSSFDLPTERQLVDDLFRAARILSIAALVMAAASAAIGGAAAILDQRLTLARLRLVGTPIVVLQRARRWQTVVPLAVASVGAMATGAITGQVLLVAFGATAGGIVAPNVAAMAVLGTAAVAAGLAVVAATRPVLTAVTRTMPRE